MVAKVCLSFSCFAVTYSSSVAILFVCAKSTFALLSAFSKYSFLMRSDRYACASLITLSLSSSFDMLAISFATRFCNYEASSLAICFLRMAFSLCIIFRVRLKSTTSLVASLSDWLFSSFSRIIRWIISCFWASSLANSCHFCRSCSFFGSNLCASRSCARSAWICSAETSTIPSAASGAYWRVVGSTKNAAASKLAATEANCGLALAVACSWYCDGLCGGLLRL